MDDCISWPIKTEAGQTYAIS